MATFLLSYTFRYHTSAASREVPALASSIRLARPLPRNCSSLLLIRTRSSPTAFFFRQRRAIRQLGVRRRELGPRAHAVGRPVPVLRDARRACSALAGVRVRPGVVVAQRGVRIWARRRGGLAQAEHLRKRDATRSCTKSGSCSKVVTWATSR